ncbi:uncharacterized protein LOC114168442 [Vigna unguiculata]|uniref:DUF1685 domain-containing protein n=1 Tax=Vigna unguiculata TaxID=3917 RepID=A0A4D6LGD0_VIGUN|nr:uncharacterized protein LOC114168442 [Vigna unguiculata]QCD87641.1 hypothetical protein DEO72_LG3g2179 [Vigna unguiculata]
MAAAAEQVLRLLDSFWFEASILSNKKTLSISHSNKVEEVLPPDSKLSLVPTPSLEVRSYSDQNLDSSSSILCDSPSPNSVLTLRRLRTIPSEREIMEFSSGNYEKEGANFKRKQKGFGHGRRLIRRQRTSKSLSELEFKELKGFMDLGFVFSEEDKDSKLVSLIPGLQRLGRDEDEGQGDDESVVSDNNMPYLSEAWDVLDQREMKNKNSLLNWRVPARGNEIDMKDNLRFWAHTVASIVR